MCTKEEVAVEVARGIKDLEDKIPEMINMEILEFLPQAIGKGIKEANLHMAMSRETREKLEEHDGRIKNVEDITRKTMDFHERVEPLLSSIEPLLERIKQADELRQGSFAIVMTIAKICGALTVIGGFITGVFWIFHTLA